MEKLYIFLDIDGVLNKKAEWSRPYTLNNDCIKCFCDFVNTARKKYDVRIVLTSSWREGFEVSGNNLPQIQTLVDKLKIYGVTISGKTPKSRGDDRLREIKYYLSRNASPTDRYLILDDDESLYGKGADATIYFTDCVKGFSEKDKKQLLNKVAKSEKLSKSNEL